MTSNNNPSAKTKTRRVVFFSALFVAIGLIGAFSPKAETGSQITQPSSTQNVQQKQNTIEKAPVVTTKTDKTYETIPYGSVTKNDATQYEGTKYVRQNGSNGVREIVYEVVYTDGVETSRVKQTTTVTKQPVQQITVNGTKKKVVQPRLNCPNGIYVNSAGNTVCRPYESSGVPAGATAVCRDGTYSFSQSRRGTCSHHGGVSRWL